MDVIDDSINNSIVVKWVAIRYSYICKTIISIINTRSEQIDDIIALQQVKTETSRWAFFSAEFSEITATAAYFGRFHFY